MVDSGRLAALQSLTSHVIILACCKTEGCKHEKQTSGSQKNMAKDISLAKIVLAVQDTLYIMELSCVQMNVLKSQKYPHSQ